MKFLSKTVHSPLALSLILASIAAAQPAGEAAPRGDSLGLKIEFPALPVAEAKKRYLESQKHLDALAKGGGIAEITHHETDLEIAVVKPSRDQLRAAVAAAYDARRQLQQSELAELERRIANIKRALAISDAMKETIIEQRTDELLDEMQTPPAESDAQAAETNHRLLDLDAQIAVEEAEAQLKAAKNAYEYSKKMHSKGFVTELDVESKASAVKKATLELERAKVKAGRAAAAPAPSNADAIETDARLLKLDVDEAKAKLDSAERDYERVKRLYASASVSQEIVDEQADKVKHANFQLDRAVVKLDAFLAGHARELRTADEPPADPNAAEAEKTQRLAELDVQEAEANLAAAKTKFERFQRHYEEKAIEQSLLDEQAEIYKRAQIQLERAKVKLEALGGSSSTDVRDTDQTPAAGAALTEEPRIVWGQSVGWMQLGWHVEPRKDVYHLGDVLTFGLIIRNAGKTPVQFTYPRTQVLEKLGGDLTLRDAEGAELRHVWGPAHVGKDELEVSGYLTSTFEPGGTHELALVKVLIGRGETLGRANHDPSIFAALDVTAGQTAQLWFNLSPKEVSSGDEAVKLQSEPFKFRVEPRR